jgi:hypothetical protein
MMMFRDLPDHLVARNEAKTRPAKDAAEKRRKARKVARASRRRNR